MNDITILCAQALQHYQAGQPAEAERVCYTVLQLEPLHAEAIYLLGVIDLDAGRTIRAILHFHHATLLCPDQARFHHALGEAYRSRGSKDEAVRCFQEALHLDPANAAAQHGLGVVLLDQGKLDEAVESLRKSLAIQPNQPRAQTNLGRALHMLGDLTAAAASFAEAIRLKPDYAIPHNNLGAIFHDQADDGRAVVSLRRALELDPNYPEAHCNLGNALRSQGDPTAIGCYQNAIRLRPDYVKAHCYLGIALAAQGRTDEAIIALHTALRLNPDFLEALEQLGHVLLQQARWEAALPVFEHVLKMQPSHQEAFANLIRIRELLCDWKDRDVDFARLRGDAEQRLEAGRRPGITPFNTMTMPWPPELHLGIARAFSDDITHALASLRESANFSYPITNSGRLRIGYLGGTFHDHALMHLMQSMFGLHERNEFEVFIYSYGPDDKSSYRQRVQRDCDCFRDLAGLSTLESARQINADGIHILVDLMGHTGGAREAIVAMRPAPIQVSHIGFAGTMGASFIDYLIGDGIVTPLEKAADYSESLVLLPHCYLVNDREQEVATVAMSRSDFGLPSDKFVFTSFNNSYKFEPELFGIWMRILAQTPNSVLWLYSGGETVERNLRREAVARGLTPERLIFAQHRPKNEHLARLKLADLFLDTFPVNAHTGASDALWAGLPVLTYIGETFASRVAASLLANVGLPELIVKGLEEYEQRAIDLASHPETLRELRDRLAVNRMTWPLFDTPRFTRNLERAYREMWELYVAGLAPRAIVVGEP